MKTITACLSMLFVIILCMLLRSGCNRQIIDLNYRFNTAYILMDDNKFEKVRIKGWRDWTNSDAIQIILMDGTPIYTHLRNVKLTLENQYI